MHLISEELMPPYTFINSYNRTWRSICIMNTMDSAFCKGCNFLVFYTGVVQISFCWFSTHVLEYFRPPSVGDHPNIEVPKYRSPENKDSLITFRHC